MHDTKDGKGSTTTDYMEQERKRGITIQSAAVSTEWKGHQINLIDTPGHVDFTIEVNRSLRVLDGAVVVFDGVAGVEPQTETNWRLANQYNVSRMCYVNKMDRMGANFGHCLTGIRERLGANALVCHVPLGSHDEFVGMVDLVAGVAYIWTSEDKDSVWETVPLEALEGRFNFSATRDTDWIRADPEDCARTCWRRRWPRTTMPSLTFVENGAVRPGDAEEVHPQGHRQRQAASRSSAARPSRTRACSSCSTPSSTTCRTPARTAASTWSIRTARRSASRRSRTTRRCARWPSRSSTTSSAP